MLRKVLFFSLAITVAAMGLGAISPDHRDGDHDQVVPEAKAGDEVLLKSTVLMTMYGQKRLVDADASVYEIKTAMGLGTVIMIEGHVLVLTHDHWGPLDDDLQRVEYRDGTGSLLASTPGSEFIDGIRFRDGGTIVVKAPARRVNKLSPAPMGTISNGPIGLPVQKVRRAPAPSTTAQVIEAVVVAIEMKKGKQVLILWSKSGDAVVPGDSGGGIYF